MNGSLSPQLPRRTREGVTAQPAARARLIHSTSCRCNRATITAIQVYLRAHFPGYRLRHFHAPSRSIRTGMPAQRWRHWDHHVVQLTRRDAIPHCAVFTRGFLEAHAAPVVEHCLQRWKLADELHAAYVVVVAENGVSAL